MSLADDLYAKLERSILTGSLTPGERLPTQKVVADEAGVSRTVVREAMARLEAQGLAVARRGSGVFVSDMARYRAFQVTPAELSRVSDVIRLLETRLAIESEMAALAAARRTTEDIAEMRAALQRMAEVSDDPLAAAEADMAFHLAIARGTRNDYFVRLIEFLGARLVPPRNLYLHDKSPEENEAYVAKVRTEHDAILNAIVRMDVDRARTAARAHMQESLSRHSELSDPDA